MSQHNSCNENEWILFYLFMNCYIWSSNSRVYTMRRSTSSSNNSHFPLLFRDDIFLYIMCVLVHLNIATHLKNNMKMFFLLFFFSCNSLLTMSFNNNNSNNNKKMCKKLKHKYEISRFFLNKKNERNIFLIERTSSHIDFLAFEHSSIKWNAYFPHVS